MGGIPRLSSIVLKLLGMLFRWGTIRGRERVSQIFIRLRGLGLRGFLGSREFSVDCRVERGRIVILGRERSISSIFKEREERTLFFGVCWADRVWWRVLRVRCL